MRTSRNCRSRSTVNSIVSGLPSKNRNNWSICRNRLPLTATSRSPRLNPATAATEPLSTDSMDKLERSIFTPKRLGEPVSDEFVSGELLLAITCWINRCATGAEVAKPIPELLRPSGLKIALFTPIN